MKLFSGILMLSISLLMISCEKVIYVDLDTAAPKLVIDASVDWEKGSSGKEQKIKLSSRTGYYDPEFPTVSGATISIKNAAGTVFDFPESANAGEYICTDFVPVVGETYSLSVMLNGETYTATETLTGVPEIETEINQSTTGGVTGDEMEIQFSYQDDGSLNNYYMSSIKTRLVAFPEYSLESDEMFQGSKMTQYYSDKDLKAGHRVNIRLYGVSKRFFEYFNKILLASGNDGSPWQTTPAAVRGNITNQTNDKNYALGYFRLSEVSARNYTIK